MVRQKLHLTFLPSPVRSSPPSADTTSHGWQVGPSAIDVLPVCDVSRKLAEVTQLTSSTRRKARRRSRILAQPSQIPRTRRRAPPTISVYGRTVRNNTLTEVLVFHQTLSTPKASYSGRYPSGTPQGRTRKIHIFSNDPIMRTSYNTCPFHTSEVLKNYLITLSNVRARNNKQRNLK